MRLACEGCWKGSFDVITKHIIDLNKHTATCTICGTVQDIEILGEE